MVRKCEPKWKDAPAAARPMMASAAGNATTSRLPRRLPTGCIPTRGNRWSLSSPEDRPIRRSVPTRQKECRQYSGRRKKTSPKWLWPILIVTAFMVAQYVLTEFITEKVSSMSSLWSDDGDTWETEAVIRPEDFHHQTVLYDKDGILAVADWKDGDTYTDEIPVYLRNDFRPGRYAHEQHGLRQRLHDGVPPLFGRGGSGTGGNDLDLGQRYRP